MSPLPLGSVGPLYAYFPAGRPSEAAARIEDMGYDSLWIGDHALFNFDGLVGLGALAAATDRLTVGTAVYLLALRHPVLVARALATLMTEAPGRIVLGVGAGGDIREEFDAVGVDLRTRGRAVDESIEQVRSLLSGAPDIARFDTVPEGGPPPVWIGGRSPAAVRRAALLGDGFLPYLVTPEQFGRLRSDVEQIALENGRELNSFAWVPNVHLAVETDVDAARRGVYDFGPYDMSEQHIEKYCLMVDPEGCVRGLTEYLDSGANHLVLNLVCPPARKMAQLELIAREVLPALRAAR